ncbi:uncharacterized protein THITE_2089412 [Thermothielavioides terrestris NRRL 8126]|jgi:hypothetical protein|uniref:Glycoside hydrolase family 61 protein n=1 Tax=Thermothielavioides terrestris (strain ATCC 38088 / NRRL 8126) TaxID=578455 RepID=G2R7K6_THETT|nr:uncharacterized protein THITE_2089412 [Thermothielavioides terrestris NRRL 8126]AEO67915.1 hypothetical protein THITE_2089412 [Thermothielavioides terrestris NRRL 8126]
MKAIPSLVLAGAGLALAATGRSSGRRDASLFKRTGYNLCESDCNLAGMAYPDKHTLQLMLENYWSEQCPPIYIGSDANAPTATSKVCLDIIDADVYFNFSSFPGYTYQDAVVTWKLIGNLATPDQWSPPPPPASTVSCGPNPSGDGLACKLPFSDILGASASSSIEELLAGMCPNGDSAGLGLYLEFAGDVLSAADGSVAQFHQSPPCTARDATGQCTARDTSYSYIEMAYRCSVCDTAPACPTSTSTSTSSTSTTTSSTSSTSSTTTTSSRTTTSTPPPVATSCSGGTAFGYQPPAGTTPKSTQLDTLSGQGCNRWGWYMTPTLAELQAGSVFGTLYVGAGGNDISKATNVGIWSAAADGAGRVTVVYTLNPGYGLAEVHVDLACLPLAKCAPGQYTFGQSGLRDLPTFVAGAGGELKYPSCRAGSKAALIVHAAVDVIGGACK